MTKQQEVSINPRLAEAFSKLMYMAVVSVDNEKVQECTELMESMQSDKSSEEELKITIKYIDNEYSKHTY